MYIGYTVFNHFVQIFRDFANSFVFQFGFISCLRFYGLALFMWWRAAGGGGPCLGKKNCIYYTGSVLVGRETFRE